MAGEDRLTALLEQTVKRVTGIDFVQVVDPDDQTVLRVFFLIDPDQLADPIVPSSDLPAEVPPETVHIVSISGGEQFPEVPVKKTTYLQVSLDGETRTALQIQTASPGDFSMYRLTVVDEPKDRIDRYFNGVLFSFKQGCPSGLDCKPKEGACPPEELVDFPVDYLARDFVSFRSALLDFAAQRYPDWTERIEADAGVMLTEIMAALGDELSYVQDRYAREAYLESASQRRSLRRHMRLVDYHLHDGLSPSAFLDLRVKPGLGVFLPAGSRVWASGQGIRPITFELGEGLADTTAKGGDPKEFWVHPEWNEIKVHIPDVDQPCLPVGSTEVFLFGHFPLAGQIPAGQDPLKFWLGKWLLLHSEPQNPALPKRRHLVQVQELQQLTDPLFMDGSGNPQPVTRVAWKDEQALPFEMCLLEAQVNGNLVSATAGETIQEFFTVRGNEQAPETDPKGDPVRQVVERQGPLNHLTGRRSITYLHSLGQTESRGLGWLGNLSEATPEIELQEVNPSNLHPPDKPQIWKWRRTLLDARSLEDVFTLDHGSWRRVIGFRRMAEVIAHEDYAADSGLSIRFGDGEFGKIPADGTVFQVRYRTGPGREANIPADTVTELKNPLDESQSDLAGALDGVSNPLPIENGVDPEDAETARRIVPEAFRALTFRAVRTDDYEEIAERQPWVQRAGARFRWTGSWLSAFVTPDPLEAFELSPERQRQLEAVMSCVRQAGREVFVNNPRYVNLELEVFVCVEPSAYPGQVKERVLEALAGTNSPNAVQGFFHPDRFTFGTPLRRPALEAAIQKVPGVLGVERLWIRARGITDWREFTESDFGVGSDQVIRLQNDPRFPERGSLRIVATSGGHKQFMMEAE